jgi:hypothetical protein
MWSGRASGRSSRDTQTHAQGLHLFFRLRASPPFAGSDVLFTLAAFAAGSLGAFTLIVCWPVPGKKKTRKSKPQAVQSVGGAEATKFT